MNQLNNLYYLSIFISTCRLNDFFDEYFLGGLHRAAMLKFLRTHLANQSNDAIPHIRPWLLAKINNLPIKSQL